MEREKREIFVTRVNHWSLLYMFDFLLRLRLGLMRDMLSGGTFFCLYNRIEYWKRAFRERGGEKYSNGSPGSCQVVYACVLSRKRAFFSLESVTN